MKVTDLMIGDWIQVKRGLNGHLTNEKIKGLIDDDTEPYPITLATGETVSLKDVVLIPLTEDILAKNFGGYDHIDYDKEARLPCYFVGNRRVFVDSIMDKGHCFYFCHKDDWAGLHDIEIHYVHQLQHLLRLCSIEKEIEL